uniref:NADH-ubiquinone oxidoreductase chain 4 n=1 Tax=Chiropterargas boueti TaxID=1827022 RepID=A0A1P8AG59_9ACAR|nr:NADH dehydrogenase subunit 4 [Chiropterargas boueti]AMX74113.1 NADH dehydrogenase subunit 4 [Chiropterargas boueti]
MMLIMMILLTMVGFYYLISVIEIIVYVLLIFFLLFLLMDWSSEVMYINMFFMMDSLSMLLVLLTMWISCMMYMTVFDSCNIMLLFYMNLLMLLLILCFSVINMMSFYILFESVLLPMVMIIFGWGGQMERLQAGLYMLFYTVFGSLPLLLFILWNEPNHCMFWFKWINEEINIVYFIFAMVAFIVKLPVYFFHLWLPKAHVEAPLIGSMILAGVLLKLGIYGIYRIKFLFMKEYMCYGMWLQSLCMIGGLYICFLCMCQVDIKSLIAYSSISHMSLMMGGVISCSNWGEVGMFLMMIGHGLCSSGLFCLANIMYERVYTRSLLLLKGMGCLYPSLSFWWFIFVIINMAAPPSMNMGAEIFLFGSLVKWCPNLFFPIMLVSFLTACYSLHLYSYVNHGKGWVVFSVKNLCMQENLVLYAHAIPLGLWVMKFEMFIWS